MATAPYFVLSPNTILSLAGLLHGPDKTSPTPAEDWRKATVDVIIPSLNEEQDITLCLTSLARQTLKPRRIILVDDGSRDHTLEYAESFCAVNGIELISIRRRSPIGKTPTLKRQSREFDSDVEFILDADTLLDSPNYIERTVQELYQGAGIASACGTILPMRPKDRERFLEMEPERRFLEAVPGAAIRNGHGTLHDIDWGITNLYRGVLYRFLQRFVYRGEMAFFGTIANPVGCAVAYRRKYLKDLFDHYEPLFGDDLTNSEDIFIGFALLAEGYRNIQLQDVTALTHEPDSHRLPHQLYLWSSAFLQSCYYFDSLLRSPFKSFKRYRHRKRSEKVAQEHRKIAEPYRQAFGRDHTAEFGRPMGWVLLMGAIEKVGFPTALLIMAILRLWEPLVITVIAETVVSLTILTLVTKGQRIEYLAKGILITPLRYLSLFYDLITMGRFAFDVWFRRTAKWRK